MKEIADLLAAAADKLRGVSHPDAERVDAAQKHLATVQMHVDELARTEPAPADAPAA